MSHKILVSKLRDVDINPYILNWLISFVSNRKQRVVVDISRYNQESPPGTVLGPILYNIKSVSSSSLSVKYADEITVSISVCAEDSSVAELEVNSIEKFTT